MQSEVLKEESYDTEGQLQRNQDILLQLRSDRNKLTTENNQLQSDLLTAQSGAEYEQEARYEVEQTLERTIVAKDQIVSNLRRTNANLNRELDQVREEMEQALDRAHAAERRAAMAQSTVPPQGDDTTIEQQDQSMSFIDSVSHAAVPHVRKAPAAQEPSVPYRDNVHRYRLRAHQQAKYNQALEYQLRSLGVEPIVAEWDPSQWGSGSWPRSGSGLGSGSGSDDQSSDHSARGAQADSDAIVQHGSDVDAQYATPSRRASVTSAASEASAERVVLEPELGSDCYARREDLDTQWSSVRADWEAVQADLDRTRVELEQKTTQLETQELNHRMQLQTALNTARTESDDLRRAHLTSRSEFQELQQAHTQLVSDHERLKVQLDSTATQLRTATQGQSVDPTALETMRTQRDDARNAVHDLEIQLDTIKGQDESVHDRLVASEQREHDLMTALESTKEDRDRLSTSMREHQTTREELYNQLQDARQLIMSLEQRVAQTEAQLDELRTTSNHQVAHLQSELVAKQSDLNTIRTALVRAKEHSQSELDSVVGAHQVQVDTLRKNYEGVLHESDQRLRTLQAQVEQITEERTAARVQVEQTQADLDQTRRSCEKHTQQLSQYRTRLDTLQQQNDQARTTFVAQHDRTLTEMRSEHNSALGTLQAQLDSSTHAHEAAMRQARERHATAMTDQVAQTTAATTQVASLERRFEKLRAELVRVRSERDGPQLHRSSSDSAEQFHDAHGGTSPPRQSASQRKGTAPPARLTKSIVAPGTDQQGPHGTLPGDRAHAPKAAASPAAAAVQGVRIIGGSSTPLVPKPNRDSAGTFGAPHVEPPMFSARAVLNEVQDPSGSQHDSRPSDVSPVDEATPHMSKPPMLSVPPPPSGSPPPGPAPQRSQSPIHQHVPGRPRSRIPRELLRKVNSSPALSKASDRHLDADEGPSGTAMIERMSTYARTDSVDSDAEEDATEPSDRLSVSSLDDHAPTPVNVTAPAVIPAVTATMIGSYLLKYVRGLRLGSDKRHKRYVWIHPYSRTLYWGTSDPSTTSAAKTKSVMMEGVSVVQEMAQGAYHESIVVHTATRPIKFTALDQGTHQTWITSLRYLVSRSDDLAAPPSQPQQLPLAGPSAAPPDLTRPSTPTQATAQACTPLAPRPSNQAILATQATTTGRLRNTSNASQPDRLPSRSNGSPSSPSNARGNPGAMTWFAAAIPSPDRNRTLPLPFLRPNPSRNTNRTALSPPPPPPPPFKSSAPPVSQPTKHSMSLESVRARSPSFEQRTKVMVSGCRATSPTPSLHSLMLSPRPSTTSRMPTGSSDHLDRLVVPGSPPTTTQLPLPETPNPQYLYPDHKSVEEVGLSSTSASYNSNSMSQGDSPSSLAPYFSVSVPTIDRAMPGPRATT